MSVESSRPSSESDQQAHPGTDDPLANLLQFVQSTALAAEQIAARTAQIHANMLSKSKHLDGPNYTKIHAQDVGYLFLEYDNAFFAGRVRALLGKTPLSFGLSKRMTSAGGKTVCYTDRRNGNRRYEISAASTMLYGCFRGDDHRPITACGIVCRDRLEALQRVMEHEFVHLTEMLLWNRSSCGQERFHSITRRFFGHTQHKHQLITPVERAIVKFGIKAGMKVRFQFEGVVCTGTVNRIRKRATVLVEDSRGTRYSDGKHYTKFYVPVQKLEAIP